MAAPTKTETKLIPVKWAQLHSALMCTQSNTTLDQIKTPGIKMEWQPHEGMHIFWKGKHHLIPSVNFKEIELES